MKNFKQLDLPIVDEVYECLCDMRERGILKETITNKLGRELPLGQICLNTTPANPDDYAYGFGNLEYDWINAEIGKQGKIEHVPLRDIPLKEEDFTVLCSQFLGTPLETVYNILHNKYILGRVRIMMSEPKTCLTWHQDTSPRAHYPIKTQRGCNMVIDDEVQHMPLHTWWWANTELPHTAFNGSKETRYHIVAVILGER